MRVHTGVLVVVQYHQQAALLHYASERVCLPPLRPEKKVHKFLISGHSSSKPFQIMDIYNNMCDKPIHCEIQQIPLSF